MSIAATRMVAVRQLLALLALVPLAAPAPALAQRTASAPGGGEDAPAMELARERIRGHMAEANLPGLSIAVGRAGEVVWSEGFGWADLENRVPVTPLHRFRVGSVSKPLAAAAIGILVERGRLDLDAPVQRYVPEFPAKRWPITSRQVAGHIAGIRHYNGAEFLSAERYGDVRESLATFAEDTLLFEPGTAYSYSTYGWNLLSAVVQSAAGEEFLSFMRREVFDALNMRHTVAGHTDSIIDHRVRFYDRGRDGRLLNSPYVDNSNKWAGGGFLSTPEDLVRFAYAHMNPTIMRPQTVAMLFEPMRLATGESTDYGIGWRDYTQDGRRAVGHTGGSVGGTTALLLYPDDDVVVAIVVNMSSAPGLVALAREIADAFAALN
jgi:serine beta-lactamase-like protein LACTB, mitochondrial